MGVWYDKVVPRRRNGRDIIGGHSGVHSRAALYLCFPELSDRDVEITILTHRIQPDEAALECCEEGNLAEQYRT